MSDLICVFDVGTTGTRTILFDINGKQIAKAYEEYPVFKQPVGISEQDPISWWNAVKRTCNKAIRGLDVNSIIGISASFMRGTTTIIDREGNVLHPALTWMDEREETNAKDWDTEGGLRRSIPKILWLKKNKPELFNKVAKIVYADTYLYMKLCDAIVTDPTNGVWGILSLETLEWDENLAELYDLPLNLWPDLYSAGDIVGSLSSTAAKDLGLKTNIPIIMGGGDQQCSALGLGTINNGQVKITMGTGTFVDYVVDNPVKAAGDFPIFSLPSVIKGKWNIEGAIPGTGTALKWFKDNFSQLQIKESQEQNINVYDMLAAEAKEISPGSEGLLFIPLYMFRKGTIHGLGWNHTRGHMIRSIMESSALSAQMYLNLIEGMGGGKVDEVRADGGAMNSGFWAQMLADILDRKVHIPEIKDGAAMGAGILGFYGCKKFNSIEKALENMVRFSDVKTPIKENVKVYKKLNRIFMPALLDIYLNKRVTKKL